MLIHPRILILSRSAVGSDAMDDQLRTGGAEPLGCRSGFREALEYARLSRPDILLAVVPRAAAAEQASVACRLAAELALPVVFVDAAGPDDGLVLPADWRQRVDQALLQWQERLSTGEAVGRERGFFHDNPLPIWVFEERSGRITEVNRAACLTYGYRRDEFLQLDTASLQAPPDAVAAPAEQPAGENGQPAGVYEGFHRRKNGSVFAVRVAVRKLSAGARPERFAVVQEISELERLQERTERNQRLEGLGLLALGLAHDLNNILAPVLFVGPLLRASTSAEETARYVDSLEISVQRGATLLRQIMALAQGGTSIRRAATIRHIVRDAITSLDHVVPRTIRVESLLPTDSWPAEINPTQIYQATINLCLNACDAMPAGGILRVEISNHVFPSAGGKVDRPGPWLCLAVSDTGTGIPAAVLERMWEPFFSTKQAGKGTGLGLPGVRGIVDEHGGFIEVQTREGEGSCFRVFLPARPDLAGSEQPPQREALARGAEELVLLVEDDASLREVLTDVLRTAGYRVVGSADGVDAIVKYNAHASEIALVLTDVNVPHLSGAVLAHTLRKLNRRLPILVLSGLSDDPPVENELAQAKEAATAYAHKSITPELLLQKIRALISAAATP